MVAQDSRAQALYQAFYTKSTPIVDFMLAQLQLQPEDKVLEPCGGDGVFVDAILDKGFSNQIDVCELNADAYLGLKNKYELHENVSVKHTDTLLDENLRLIAEIGGGYDKIIANPPYGAWQEIEKRNVLKKIFPGHYVKESYALFLIRAIDLLKNKGCLVFIIPDTFLDIHRHSALREKILKQGRIKAIALFPSNFFPNVNFGYANLAILTFEKNDSAKKCIENQIKILSNFAKVEQLNNYANSSVKATVLQQKKVLQTDNYSFMLSDNDSLSEVIQASKLSVGDIANCVTGIYSGNDKAFLRAISHEIKFASKYPLIESKSIFKGVLQATEKTNGIKGEACFLPILKGGNVRFVKPDNWYLEWSEWAINHYKTDNKARFQNSNYYFKNGVGVPMVRSSSITGALINNRVFDQSIVGVFPKDENNLFLLLAFFNSKTCNKLINALNSTVNSSANYIKRIPFIMPKAEVIREIDATVEAIVSNLKQDTPLPIIELEERINSIFLSLYGF